MRDFPWEPIRVFHPARGRTTVQGFKDWRSAWEHINHHIFSPPESQAWGWIDPRLGEIVPLHNPDALYALARRTRSAWHPQDQDTYRKVYQIYMEQVDRELREAQALGWYICQDSLCVAVGTIGIILVIYHDQEEFPQGVLLTAFVGGAGIPEVVGDPEKGTLLRNPIQENSLRIRHIHPREYRRLQRRQEKWSREQWLFYRVFRPCVQFIHCCHRRSLNLEGRKIPNDYALLKKVLPPRSNITFETWKKWKQQLGGNRP